VFRYDDLPLEASIDRDGLLPLVRQVGAFIRSQIAAIP